MTINTPVYLEFIRKILLTMPGVTEKLCFGTPAFYVNKKIFCRMKEDGETLVIQTLERDKWLDTNPEVFFVTDHYLNYDYMLITLKNIMPEELEKLLVTAWRNRATAKIIKAYEENINS